MGIYYFGQVITVFFDDGQRRSKSRPAIIISSDDDNDAGEDLLVVAISSRIEDPCPPYHIKVHDSKTRDPQTGLWYPCVAKCNWIREIDPKRVEKRIGNIPDTLLRVIVETYDRLQADQSFTDWQ